jgi:hypothetical protein
MRRIMALACIASLSAACGGGSGGGRSGVYIERVSPTSIEDESYEGMTTPSATFAIDVGGDLASLSGRTVYVFVVVPDAIFDAPTLRPLTDTSVELVLSGVNGVAPGIYADTLQILACLDTSCTTQLGNSPLEIPYSITVHPGLALSPSPLSVSVPFGTRPEQSVAVQLPEGTTSWTVRRECPTCGGYVAPAAAPDGSPRIDVTYHLAPVGHHTDTWWVDAWVSNPSVGSSLVHFSKQLDVVYDVTPNPGVGLVVDPPQMSYQVALDDPTQKHVILSLTPHVTGGEGTWATSVSYVSAPVAAEGAPNVNDWLYADPTWLGTYFIIPCGTNPIAPTCLPAGTYEARITYQYTDPDAVTWSVDHAVQMIIVP